MKKQKLIIGLSGTMHSGKTTAANGLLNAYAPKACIVSLAQPIKESIQSITGHMVTKSNKETLRPLLQSYGEVMKELHGERHWIDRAEARWQLLKFNHDIMVVDDIRFPFEADWLRSLGGFVIGISRPDNTPTSLHASEEAVRDVKTDYRVDNNGTELDLMLNVLATVKNHEEKTKN